jgi:pimeloyl-ACP methyl ester carboxylesterase
MDGAPDEVPDRYREGSPADLLPLGVRQTLIHGTEDGSVPYEVSERYAARAAALGDQCDLIPLPGAGHFEPIDPRSDEWPVVQDAVLSMLGHTP